MVTDQVRVCCPAALEELPLDALFQCLESTSAMNDDSESDFRVWLQRAQFQWLKLTEWVPCGDGRSGPSGHNCTVTDRKVTGSSAREGGY
jgi:hypothetical protein